MLLKVNLGKSSAPWGWRRDTTHSAVKGSCCSSPGARVRSGQNPDGPNRPPSQLPPPFGLLATPQEKPSTPSAAPPPPARCKAPPSATIPSRPQKTCTKPRATDAVTMATAKPAHLCAPGASGASAPLLGLTCGHSVHARLTVSMGFQF